LPEARPLPAVVTSVSVTAELLQQAIDSGGNIDLVPETTATAAAEAIQPAAAGLTSDAQRLAQPFGPTHHETRCGFKVRGARVVDAASRVSVQFAGGGVEQGDDLRVSPTPPASNVLLITDSGAGVLLPAIPGFMCALTFEDSELVDVA